MIALSAAQAAAARTPSAHPLLVRAGPGAGKTRVLAPRIAHLIQGGLAPEAILGITFTNRAAEEMRARLRAAVHASAAEGVALGTCHALGARILRAHAPAIGRTPRFSIWDPEDTRAALARILPSGAGEAARAIGRHKAGLVCPLEAAAWATDGPSQALARAYAAYERELAASDALDLDDLLARAAALLERAPGAGPPARHVLVDELQDSNHAQLRLIRALVAGGRGLSAVGDEDQAIYGFRGADPGALAAFARRFPARARSCSARATARGRRSWPRRRR